MVENRVLIATSAANEGGPDAPRAPVQRESRVIQLDFLRGIAILVVVECHARTIPVHNAALSTIEEFFKRTGWMGVDLFFVLSGFLVGGLLVQELSKTNTIRVGRFLLRRILRIWPAYYSYILLEVVSHKHPLRGFLWQNLLNVQNYAGTSLAVTWSLAVEEHFYILLPILLYGIYRNRRWRARMPYILSLCCVLVLVGRLLSVGLGSRGNQQWMTHARIDSLLFGVLMSYWFYFNPRLFKRLLDCWQVQVPLILVVLWLGTFESYKSTFMWTFGFTLVYLAAASLFLFVYRRNGRITRTLLYRGVAAVGVYSYGIYLWHESIRDPVAALAMHLPASMRWGGLFVGQFAGAIGVGVLATKLIEAPALRLRDAVFPRGAAHLPTNDPEHEEGLSPLT